MRCQGVMGTLLSAGQIGCRHRSHNSACRVVRLQYRVARAAGAGPAALAGTPSMLGSVAVQEKLHAPMLAHRLRAGARPGRKA